MIKIYVGQGCVSCHKVVKKLYNYYTSDIYVERDDKIVGEVLSKTFGVAPVFEFNNVFYNEYQISSMIDEKFDFSEPLKSEPIITEEPKITNKK